jgi:hypothetical protein
MQQRQLRLGDIVDDYCPRERRVTNHAIVAMVGQDVKQTRCTTCDAEHEYKQARVPPQRKKKAAPGALYQEVLAGMPRKTPVPAASQPPDGLAPPTEPDHPAEAPATPIEPAVAAAPDEPGEPSEPREEVEGPVHRPLIRATLPRPEGQAPVRQAPEFTIRQPTGLQGAHTGTATGRGRRATATHSRSTGGAVARSRSNTGTACSPHRPPAARSTAASRHLPDPFQTYNDDEEVEAAVSGDGVRPSRASRPG